MFNLKNYYTWVFNVRVKHCLILWWVGWAVNGDEYYIKKQKDRG